MRAELGLWEDRNVPLVASHLGYGTILLVLDVLSHELEKCSRYGTGLRFVLFTTKLSSVLMPTI